MTKEEIAKLAQGNPAIIQKVEAVIKEYKEMMGDEGGSLDEKAQTALKAAARILSPFAEVLPPDLLSAVMGAAGLGETEDAGQPGEGAAGQEHELGKEFPPKEDGEGGEAEPDEDDVQKLGDGPGAAKQPQSTQNKGPGAEGKGDKKFSEHDGSEHKPDMKIEGGGNPMNKVTKSDGTLDLSGVPAAVRPAVEALYKGQQDAIKKAADLEKQLSDEKKIRVEKEYKEKAASFKHLGTSQEVLAKVLKGEATEEERTAVLKALDEQIAKGNLFSEFGSAQAAAGNTTFEQIEKAAEAYVAKSGEKITKAEAVEKFLLTSDGKKMYSQYTSQRPGGI